MPFLRTNIGVHNVALMMMMIIPSSLARWKERVQGEEEEEVGDLKVISCLAKLNSTYR